MYLQTNLKNYNPTKFYAARVTSLAKVKATIRTMEVMATIELVVLDLIVRRNFQDQEQISLIKRSNHIVLRNITDLKECTVYVIDLDRPMESRTIDFGSIEINRKENCTQILNDFWHDIYVVFDE